MLLQYTFPFAGYKSILWKGLNICCTHIVAPCGDAAFVDPAGQVDELCVVLFQRGGAVGVIHALGHDRTALAGVQDQQKKCSGVPESERESEKQATNHQ